MDAIFLSRLQFVFSAFFHFLFPPITIGMIIIIAIIEFLYWRTGKELYDQMARFWFRLFTIIFAVLIPLLINELGWFAAEIGRQPWIVYGILKTNLAASPLPAYQLYKVPDTLLSSPPCHWGNTVGTSGSKGIQLRLRFFG